MTNKPNIEQKHRVLSAGILFADVGCVPIDHCPVPGELVPTGGIELSLGGCASNLAMNLARLGIRSGLCGMVGDDSFSDFIISSLEHPLIDTTGLARMPNACPGTTLIVNVKGEDRRFISTTGANAGFTTADIPTQWAQEADVIYLGGYLMMPKLEAPETAEFLKAFQARGGKTILDVVLYGDRPYWDVIRPLLPYVDYFMPNDHEGERISGLADPIDQARFFLDAGCGAVVITCGESGSIYYSAEERFKTGIFNVEFVGGTGSGDAFAAGFAAGLLDHLVPFDLMKQASAQGASAVRHSSATASVFNREELNDFVAKNTLSVEQL